MTRKYEGRCVVVRRSDGYHIIDLVTKVESGIIPGGYEEALRGARNLENAREDCERTVAEFTCGKQGVLGPCRLPEGHATGHVFGSIPKVTA